MTMVRFAGVSKSFGEKRVLDDLSLTVKRGEVYGLLGPNGCGKSTAINISSNLLDPDAGTIEVDDKPTSGDVKSVLGVCPQEIALYLRPQCPPPAVPSSCRRRGSAGSTALVVMRVPHRPSLVAVPVR